MRRPISQAEIQAVRAGLDAGESERELAARLGISRYRVAQIATRHCDQLRGVRELDRPVRCSEGHRIYVVPCIECAAAAYRKRGQHG